MTATKLQMPAGELRLERPGGGAGLQAWDAADELLLASVEPCLEEAGISGKPRTLVVDDQFGALSLGLAGFAPVLVADSAALSGALSHNAGLNPGLPALSGLHNWQCPPAGPFDLVVLRIPRQASYLAWLLRWLNTVLAENGRILAGGMIKHLPERSVDVFSGAVVTEAVLPAKKKARVVVCRRGEAMPDGWQEAWKGYSVPGLGHTIEALPAVFAREKLDIGTRELLPFIAPAMARLPEGARVMDLACGNGILGLLALSCQSRVDLHFSDVSSQAMVSVARNLKRSGMAARLWHQDGIADEAPAFDLILLNPPFHEGGVVGDHIAVRLFRAVADHLAPEGRLLLVGNRHLGYHQTLKRYFGHVEQKSAAPKFVVFEASEPRRKSQSVGRS